LRENIRLYHLAQCTIVHTRTSVNKLSADDRHRFICVCVNGPSSGLLSDRQTVSQSQHSDLAGQSLVP
jgi:hypothetical protein